MTFRQLYNKVLDATHGGLDVILYYYPAAQDVIDGKVDSFKFSIYGYHDMDAQIKVCEREYCVVFRGHDTRNILEITEYCESQKGINEYSALYILASRYGVYKNFTDENEHVINFMTEFMKNRSRKESYLYEFIDTLTCNISKMIDISYDLDRYAKAEQIKAINCMLMVKKWFEHLRQLSELEEQEKVPQYKYPKLSPDIVERLFLTE